MSFNLGINVVETDGRAVPSIQPAATSVAGFIIRAERGAISDRPLMVTNWRQFQDRFGGYLTGVDGMPAKGAYAVRGFFDNGGSTAWVTRVFNDTIEGGMPARLVSAPGPWDLGEGGTVDVKAGDADVATSVTFEAGPAELTGGSEFTGLRGTTLTLTVDRDRTEDYRFADETPETVDAATVAATVNREFTGVRAWLDDDGKLRVRTDRRGGGAALEAEGDAAAVLGLDIAAGSGPVGDLRAVTAGEAVAVFLDGLRATTLTVDRDGDRIVIGHPDTGTANTITVENPGPAASAFGFAFTSGSAGPLHARTAQAAQAVWRQHDRDLLTFTAGRRGAVDPGAWGNNLRVVIAKGQAEGSADVEIRRAARQRGEDVVAESWTGLSLDPADPRWLERVLNRRESGSGFVTVDVSPEVAQGKIQVAAEPVKLTLQGGADDVWPPDPRDADAAYAAAIARFERIPIQLLCCPETDSADLVHAALAHCETMGDRMFVGHTPQNHDFVDASGFTKNGLQRNKAYGALYFPWITVANPAGGDPIEIPPDGHVLGVYARTERERGIWKAPAGNAALVNGALGVRFELTDAEHTDLVKKASVNAIRFIPGQGIVIDSSRTLSTNTLWLYASVRLLFNFVKTSLKDGLRWTVQEPNTEELWRKVEHNTVRPFLMDLWRRGAFGPGAPEEVFDVKCDAENNPSASIQQGLLTVEVSFYPSRPAETIVITVGQQDGGGSAAER